MRAIVVGGGIGGLAMALSLHQVGIAVRLYEAVRSLTPQGVGINIQPNAVRELAELGLGPALEGLGIATRELAFFNKFGQLIYSEPRGRDAGFNWPQYSLHRGRLQMLLRETAIERIGGEDIREGCRLVAFESHPDRVVATVEDRTTGATWRDEADVLIGADGIHSTVRRALYPGEGAPRFARQILWRAASEIEPVLGGRTMAVAGHFDQRVVLYPIAESADRSGRLLTNWICQMTVPDDGPPPREDWNRRVPREKVLAAFGDWRFPWLDVAALIAQTEEIYEFPLVDRDPVDRWSFDRVTLIGDAAHPMQPTGSQAGSQAIVDARVLTAMLAGVPDPSEALRRYEAMRRPAMNEVTLRNRNFGPEAAMQLVEERAPDGFARIEDVISADEMRRIAQSFAAAAGLDVDTVNGRPSFVQRAHVAGPESAAPAPRRMQSQ